MNHLVKAQNKHSSLLQHTDPAVARFFGSNERFGLVPKIRGIEERGHRLLVCSFFSRAYAQVPTFQRRPEVFLNCQRVRVKVPGDPARLQPKDRDVDEPRYNDGHPKRRHLELQW